MDIAFIGWNRSPLYRFGVSPNKLFDYMMAGRPVVHAIDAGNDLVSESGCGVSVPPENPQAIANAILCLFKMSQKERKAMGQNGREYVKTHHDYSVLAKKFLEGF
jgi:glycosyltransferase involved in cell wall biosynthesis